MPVVYLIDVRNESVPEVYEYKYYPYGRSTYKVSEQGSTNAPDLEGFIETVELHNLLGSLSSGGAYASLLNPTRASSELAALDGDAR